MPTWTKVKLIKDDTTNFKGLVNTDAVRFMYPAKMTTADGTEVNTTVIVFSETHVVEVISEPQEATTN